MASTQSASARRKSGSTRAASTKRSRAARRSSSGNGSSPSPVDAVRDTVSNGAQSIASGASKAKGPALTGGAAIAGLLGGMAIVARGGRRKVLGVPIPGTRRPLVQIKTPRRKGVAKDVMKAGGQMAELASEVRQAREQLNSRQRRSPIEVVLEGLTSRRGRAG